MILDQVVYTSGDNAVTVFDLVFSLIVVIVTIVIAKIVAMNFARVFQDKISKDNLRNMIKLFYFIAIIISLIIILPILGIDPMGLLVAGGIIAIVIGFATQSIIGNAIAGLFLLMEKPMKIGNAVDIGGTMGIVEDVKIMSTTVRQFDGVYVRIPNEKVFTNEIKNFDTNVVRRFEYTIGIRYQDDADKAIEAIKNTIDEHPLTLVNPGPQIFVDNLGDSSVNIIVRVWSPSSIWYDVKMELLWKMKTALEDAGIQIPFPQRELWFNNELKMTNPQKS